MSGRFRLTASTIGGVLLGLVVFATLLAPIAGDPLEISISDSHQAPSGEHWLGTDALGRDLASRLLHGGRASLISGFVATLLACLIGFALGAVAGAASPSVDRVISRGVDLVNAFPMLIGALALLTALTPWTQGANQSVLLGAVIGLFWWPMLYRVVRGEVRRWRQTDVADAATAIGAGRFRVAWRHLFPLALTPALVPAAFIAASTLLAEAGLGFLGLSIRPPNPSWGNLLLDAYTNRQSWWMALFPGLTLLVCVLGLYLIAEGLQQRTTRRGAESVSP